MEFLKDMLRISVQWLPCHMLQYYIEENEERHESLMENIIRDDKTKSEGRLVGWLCDTVRDEGETI